MLFMFPVMLLMVAIVAAVVLVVAYLLLLPLQVSIKPKGPNRYGPESATRDPRQAIANGFRRALDFSGRANRLDFWIFAVTVGALCFAAFVLVVLIAMFTAGVWGKSSPWVLTPLVLIPVLAVPSLSMAVRRLHDVNRSGWWLLVLCAAGVLTLLYWFVQPSQSDAQAKAEIFA
jgi:uncharacterized membrane protein YhaH (DUF805 family)